MSSGPCVAAWVAEGSEVPLDPAPLELLQGCTATGQVWGRPGGEGAVGGHGGMRCCEGLTG